MAAVTKYFEQAILIGELLLEQKKITKYGNWELWLKMSVPFSAITASRYIKVFENRGEIRARNITDLHTAYRLLGIAKKRRPLPTV
jgi:hypothetical protein